MLYLYLDQEGAKLAEFQRGQEAYSITILQIFKIMEHLKVVFQLSTENEKLQKNTLRQIQHVLNDLPGICIELVVHGDGAALLLKSSVYSDVLAGLYDCGVRFLLCSNTMKSKNIGNEDLLPAVKVISSGVAYLILKQAEGWSYIKGG